MLRAVVVLCVSSLVVASSCAKREDPAWSKPGAGPTGGDATVGGPPAKVPRAAAAPAVDGALDDAAWATAATLGPFVDPGQGEPDPSPLAGSFAKVTWDEQALHLGFVVPDRTPAAPFGPDEDDPHLWEQSSAVELMIQPGDPGDNRDYYELQFDTKRARFETHWDDYNVPIVDGPSGKRFGHQDWKSGATVAARVEADRFYALEISLPWSAFQKARVAVPPKKGDVWRVNLYAFRDGQRLANAWSPIRRQGNFHKAARWGRIVFE